MAQKMFLIHFRNLLKINVHHATQCNTRQFSIACSIFLKNKNVVTRTGGFGPFNMMNMCDTYKLLITENHVVIPRRNRWFTNSLKGPKIPPTTHLDFDMSGDKQQTLPETDMLQPKVEYNSCRNLEDASETVKKIISLKFGNSMDLTNHHITKSLKRIQRHDGDMRSPEVRIAIMTMKIKSLIPWCLKYRKDIKKKQMLLDMISKRRKYLKRLKWNDLPRFKWICKELDIEYIAVPPPEVNFRKTIRMKRRAVVEEACEALVEEKRLAYHAELEQQRKDFLVEKETIMAEIEAKLKEFNLHGPTLLREVEEKTRKEEEAAEFLKKHPTPKANNKYITVKVKES